MFWKSLKIAARNKAIEIRGSRTDRIQKHIVSDYKIGFSLSFNWYPDLEVCRLRVKLVRKSDGEFDALESSGISRTSIESGTSYVTVGKNVDFG